MPGTGNLANNSVLVKSWISEGKPVITTLLNWHDPQLCSKYLSFYSHISVIFTLHQGSFPVQETLLQKTTTYLNAELWSLIPMDTSTIQLREQCRIGGVKIVRTRGLRDQEICCGIVFPSNVCNYTHKVSSIWLPKHKLNRDKEQ